MTQIHSPANTARQVHALLTDGTTVRIRQAEPADHDAVLALYEGMSAENLRRRFFTVSHLSAEQAADRLTRRDRSGYRALVAESGGRFVGLAEYEAIPESATAEIALSVADDWHHRGLGTLLLEHLVDAARQAGITAFAADALAENHEMLKVFADLGLRTTRHFDGPEVRCIVQLTLDEHYLSAVDNRASTADVASLQPLLRPRTVAVVGAGRRAGSVGRAVLRNLRTGGFAGRLDAVNPHADAIEWVSCHHSVTELSFPPDLAVLAVPAAAVPRAAEDCGKLGARALLVVSSGLDAQQAAALLATCRAYGMRLVGPNCLGLANTNPDLRLNATFAADRPWPARPESPCSPVGWASRCSTGCPGSASGCPPSSRWATSTTSAATTCCSGGRATGRPTSLCCTLSPSAIRAHFHEQRGGWPARCRSLPWTPGAPRPVAVPPPPTPRRQPRVP